ncbi:unnamed protein product [Symbiodinium sp. CCMP2592]|nr:unnamed protein product [Symbiodinium sp. CCMP2592]
MLDTDMDGTAVIPWRVPIHTVHRERAFCCGVCAQPPADSYLEKWKTADGRMPLRAGCAAAIASSIFFRSRQTRRHALQLRDAPGCKQNGCTCATQAENYPFKTDEDYQLHHPAVRRLTDWQRASERTPPEVVAAEPCGHRTRAKLAVAPSKDGVVLGLFKRGTQEVLPALGCAALHPTLRVALRRLKGTLDRFQALAIYQPGVKSSAQSSQGALRFVQLTVERASNQVQLVLVWNRKRGPAIPALERLVEMLWDDDEPGDVWHSIWIHWREPKPNLGNFVFALETLPKGFRLVRLGR